MEELDLRSEDAKILIKKYNESNKTKLEQVYKIVPDYALKQFKLCMDMKETLDGIDGRVLCINPKGFIYGYIIYRGIHKHLIIQTPAHDFDIDLEETL